MQKIPVNSRIEEIRVIITYFTVASAALGLLFPNEAFTINEHKLMPSIQTNNDIKSRAEKANILNI